MKITVADFKLGIGCCLCVISNLLNRNAEIFEHFSIFLLSLSQIDRHVLLPRIFEYHTSIIADDEVWNLKTLEERVNVSHIDLFPSETSL